MNFVEKNNSSGHYGSQGIDNTILDNGIYKNAFERIENAIFISSSQ